MWWSVSVLLSVGAAGCGLIAGKQPERPSRCRIHSLGLDGTGRVRNAAVPRSDGYSTTADGNGHSFATTDRDADVHASAYVHRYSDSHALSHKHAHTDVHPNADGDADRDPHEYPVAHRHFDSHTSSNGDAKSVSDP